MLAAGGAAASARRRKPVSPSCIAKPAGLAYDGLVTGLRNNARYDGGILALVLLAPALVAASRDLDWFDGPELAMAAASWGVAHPPGEPLHAILGGILARIFPTYLGVTLASVLPLCLLAIPTLRLVDRLYPPETPRARLLRAATIAACLLFPPVFETGTRVEVYCLAALPALFALDYAVARRPLQAGVMLGLSACANPAFAVFAAVAVFVLLVRSLRALLWAFVGGLLGLLPYVYLPWAGLHPERFVYGEPTRLSGMIDILLLRAFQHNMGFSVAHTLSGLVLLKGLVIPTVLGLLVASLGLLGGRARGLGAALLLLGVLHLFSILLNKPLPHNPDLQGYLIPAALVSGIGLAALLGRLAARRSSVLGVALCLPLFCLGLDGAWIRARAGGIHAMRELADAYLNEAPPRAVVILVYDHLYWPMLYRQEIEHARPDVVLINLGLIGNAWFWNHQRAVHPELSSLPGAELPPARQLGVLLQQSPERPVVSQASVLLRGLGRGLCEGAFLSQALPAGGSCPPPDLGARTALLRRMAAQVHGDWIGERTLATQAIFLALESRTHGSLERAVATLAAASPELAGFTPAVPGAVPTRRVPLRRLPEDALASPDWVLYLLGQTLLELGDARGEELLARARARGVAEAGDT